MHRDLDFQSFPARYANIKCGIQWRLRLYVQTVESSSDGGVRGAVTAGDEPVPGRVVQVGTKSVSGWGCVGVGWGRSV